MSEITDEMLERYGYSPHDGAGGWCGAGKNKAMTGTNTYGKNRFREVRVKCHQCGGTQKTHMQCDTGEYEWDCNLCDERTKHTVTEAAPLRRHLHQRQRTGGCGVNAELEKIIEQIPAPGAVQSLVVWARTAAGELYDWKKAADPYAESPEGLTAELQRMEELICHGKP